MPIQVGIDLLRIDEVRASLATHGERYVQRICTAVERRDAGSSPRRLAARFAAKEATMKVLRRGDEPLPWSSIGVSEDASGRASIRLSGVAVELAQSRGVRWLDLSLTHRRSVAAAIVVAELDDE